MKKIAITLGDPNGISPEILIKSLNFLDLPKDKVVIIGNKVIFDYYKEKYSLFLEKDYKIAEIPFKQEDIKIGQESAEAGEFAFQAIRKACDLAFNKEIEAIVTAPVSKNAMNMAGHKYNGQTEVLEQYLGTSLNKAQMLFIGENFSVLLITRHIPLKDVPFILTKEMIIEKVKALKTAYDVQFGIQNPKFAVCALNPHSGENGLFGDEEIYQISPAVQELQQEGINISGPYSADTLFLTALREEHPYDCYIAMYHDQGLIPIKLLEQNCVNTTIGLSVLRTSPAHGTAFDIAGQISANPDSMINAIKLAIK